MERKTLGAFIAELRKAGGMTQKLLAEKLNVSDKSVSRWERDETTPDLSLIPVIAEIFGITSDELLRGERRPPAEASHPEQNRKQMARILRQTESKYQIQTIISLGLTFIGLLAAFVCPFAIHYKYGVLGYCLGLVFYLAAGICQAIFAVSALSRLDTDEFDTVITDPLRDRIAGAVMRLYILLLALLCGTIPVMNSSLDFWEAIFVGAMIAEPVAGVCVMLSWLLIPHLAETKGIFRADANNEALQNLRKETLLWDLWIIGLWLLLTLIYSAVGSSSDWLLIAGLILILLTIPGCLIVYYIRKRALSAK